MRHERRQSTRTPVDFFVEVQRPERAVLMPALDVSTTGLYVLAGDDYGALDAENELDLEFTLPTGHLVQARAHIAYVDDRQGQRGLALQFTELAPRDLDAVRGLVAVTMAARQRLG